MKVIDNGDYRDMTPEEEAEYLASTQTQPAEPTPEERIAALEEKMVVTDILLGVIE